MEHFVYALKDFDGNVFYIGKSVDPQKRKKRHVYDANRGLKYPVHNKIRKLFRQGLGFDVNIIERGLSADSVDERECYWIAEYKNLGYKLFNATNGGEGAKGFTSETIEKIRQAHLGSKRSMASRQKMSEARKGMEFTDEHKKNLSLARRKRKITDETRCKMRASSLGKINIGEYIVIDPNGIEHKTDKGLTDFCRNHGLTAANMHKTLSGERKHHKGWRIKNVHRQYH